MRGLYLLVIPDTTCLGCALASFSVRLAFNPPNPAEPWIAANTFGNIYNGSVTPPLADAAIEVARFMGAPGYPNDHNIKWNLRQLVHVPRAWTPTNMNWGGVDYTMGRWWMGPYRIALPVCPVANQETWVTKVVAEGLDESSFLNMFLCFPEETPWSFNKNAGYGCYNYSLGQARNGSPGGNPIDSYTDEPNGYASSLDALRRTSTGSLIATTYSVGRTMHFAAIAAAGQYDGITQFSLTASAYPAYGQTWQGYVWNAGSLSWEDWNNDDLHNLFGTYGY
jgi:hypothetical protein